MQREIDHYNLDMIIALDYRAQSPIAVRFRRWAKQRLHEYLQKGFTMDDERLKQGGNRYFKELLQRISYNIQSSLMSNFYKRIAYELQNFIAGRYHSINSIMFKIKHKQ